MVTVEFKDLVGHGWLSGVDFVDTITKKSRCYEDINVCRFRLNGVVYMATEDPEDGYRSCLDEIYKLDENEKIDNPFRPVEVMVIHKDDDYRDVLLFIDHETTETILTIGTDNYDNYYPYFVADFNPKAMIINQK